MKDWMILYSQFEARTGRGRQLISFGAEFISLEKTLVLTTTFSIILSRLGINVDVILIGLLTIVWQIFRRVGLYIIGNWDEKKLGFWKKQNEYMTKTQHLSPYNYEMKETMKVICEELKIKHKFKDI